MKKIIIFGILILSFASCKKDKILSLKTDLDSSGTHLSDQYIIACAAGMPDGFMGDTDFPVSMFFYPVEGATDYKYYESNEDNIDEWDYTQYQEISSTSIPVFNGYLRRFKLSDNKNRWGIVTYKVDDSVRICDPVHIIVESQATIWAPERMSVTQNGINPSFSWEESDNVVNAIHFNVVSDASGNLISGTYTNENTWAFYDLTDVTLNIRDVTPAPTLSPSTPYKFTLMSVSDDNWVNTFGEIEFSTP